MIELLHSEVSRDSRAPRGCAYCRGEAGFHANSCPQHDDRTCALCRKIAAIRTWTARSA